jgi:hypothetical protein
LANLVAVVNYFFDIFVDKKFQKHIYGKCMGKDFLLEKSDWSNIDKNNVCEVVDKNFAEFNNKLMHNLLCNNYLLRK